MDGASFAGGGVVVGPLDPRAVRLALMHPGLDQEPLLQMTTDDGNPEERNVKLKIQ